MYYSDRWLGVTTRGLRLGCASGKSAVWPAFELELQMDYNKPAKRKRRLSNLAMPHTRQEGKQLEVARVCREGTFRVTMMGSMVRRVRTGPREGIVWILSL